MRKQLAILAFAVFAVLAGTGRSSALQRDLSGSAEVHYGEFSEKTGEQDWKRGSFLAQQYSLVYRASDTIAGGRGGRYDYSLGYEWNALDREWDGEEVEIDTGKILYQGEVLFAPAGLPLRLHAYSNDLRQSVFIRDGFGSILDNPDKLDVGSLTPISNLSNGQHIRTGITLTTGIKNGTYMGRYREILSNFPKLYLDFNEEYVSDTESLTPTHYRDRNLAFVSLNKKDNWFHFRIRQYTDYIDPEQNFTDRTILLGTVDHLNQRQWINLTNWIKVSTDGSFTTTTGGRAASREEERFDINLFTAARQVKWRGSNFNSFSRVVDLRNDRLEKQLEVPLFLQGEIDRNTAWRFRFVGSRDREISFGTGGQTDEDILFASTQFEMRRNAPFVVTPTLEVESKQGDMGEGLAAQLRLETHSNRRYNPDYDIFASYSAAIFTGDGLHSETSFWEQNARVRVERALLPTVRGWVGQELTYGEGILDRTSLSYIIPKADLSFGRENRGASGMEGSLLRSTTLAGLEHQWRRLDNRIELSYDRLWATSGDENQTTLHHRLRYSQGALSVGVRNVLEYGSASMISQSRSGNLLGDNIGTDAEKRFYSEGSLRYAPTRAWNSSALYFYEWTDGDRSADRWRFEQESRYSFFTTTSFSRKIAEIGEKVEYERYTRTVARETATAFSLLATAYPTSISFISTRMRYKILSDEDTATLSLFLSAGLDFPMLQVALDYAYGARSDGDNFPGRKEQRWEVKVRKTF